MHEIIGKYDEILQICRRLIETLHISIKFLPIILNFDPAFSDWYLFLNTGNKILGHLYHVTNKILDLHS